MITYFFYLFIFFLNYYFASRPTDNSTNCPYNKKLSCLRFMITNFSDHGRVSTVTHFHENPCFSDSLTQLAPASKKTSRTKCLIDHKLINSFEEVAESDTTYIKSSDVDLTYYTRKRMTIRLEKHN